MAKAPEIVCLNASQLEELLGQLRPLLPAPTYQLVQSLLQTLQWLMSVIEEKKTSIARLKRLLFGHKTEKTDKILKPAKADSSSQNADGKVKAKGHGRRGASAYPGAQRIDVPHPTLHGAQLCPQCSKGKLYLLHAPAKVISIVAQPIFSATIHQLQRLRCALCGALFTAPLPPQAPTTKHHPSVGIMLAILRYGAGLPMYRIEKWQNCFGVPLPASTQWELIEAAAEIPELIFEAMIDAAADGRLLHNDDTTMRVQSLRTQISADAGEKKRTGIFTTSIISEMGKHRAALFFTGHQHAGENLDQLLKRRSCDLGQPLQMCDALSRNPSKETATELCHCLLHGRRNFVDVLDRFPEPCRKVIESLREVYRVDALAKEQGLSDLQRLYLHQEHSRPVMDDLHRWMRGQVEQKQVEPNSGLGEAIAYMLKHWQKLTRFLQIPGAPLDNNICERSLKMAILHRKNSLSYKTLNGAHIGDIFMSLIHTCQLNRVNPFDYLMTLQNNADAIQRNPASWLPWNYTGALPQRDTG